MAARASPGGRCAPPSPRSPPRPFSQAHRGPHRRSPRRFWSARERSTLSPTAPSRRAKSSSATGVIAAVGTSVEAPPDARVYMAETVIPGMIDAHAHLALDRSSRSRIPGPVTAEWKAVDNLDLDGPHYPRSRSRGGVTSLITRSGSGVISSGQSVALKMKREPTILKPYVDLKMAVRPLINLRPGETPQTVMGLVRRRRRVFPTRARIRQPRRRPTRRGSARPRSPTSASTPSPPYSAARSWPTCTRTTPARP